MSANTEVVIPEVVEKSSFDVFLEQVHSSEFAIAEFAVASAFIPAAISAMSQIYGPVVNDVHWRAKKEKFKREISMLRRKDSIEV